MSLCESTSPILPRVDTRFCNKFIPLAECVAIKLPEFQFRRDHTNILYLVSVTSH